MADTVSNDKIEEIAQLLEDHKGENTVVLDVRERCSWTDTFIITTVRSQAHLNGLMRHLYQFLGQNGVEPFKRRKGSVGNDWVLIDCGFLVIHLMSGELREFYELEKLWFGSTVVGRSRVAQGQENTCIVKCVVKSV